MCDVEWNVSGMSEISCGLERGVFKVVGLSIIMWSICLASCSWRNYGDGWVGGIVNMCMTIFFLKF